MHRHPKGFSLVELLITVAVLGIAAAIAVPNFQSSIQRSRADTEVSDLQRALNYARLEAINRGVNTRVMPSAVGGTWSGQLQVVLASAPNIPLRLVSAMSSGAVVVLGGSNSGVVAIDFNNLGGLAAPSTQLDMTYTQGTITQTVRACLNGRIVVGGLC
ncbi:GspH/FimT family pseudopilin [Pseudomonas sp. 10B1]|uniref:GspH/FimT family pseudopilin n=1 Tax=unclassified Pseudomonas TaxID=196821 RepID=UPI002AB3D827|nr:MULTISPECIES: GspH/FimT family pseudopilin [unclassified Pseudomonas]MDY7561917.1 GspH/FimT family pseudopilin [Pseudomonas sp. AB6]MEA9976055.1 GspH/FimT family pseudopilin [Pseudomonas sp. RTS4]MEA9993439.1 GspH/FimT family pseudopilin [Pseudomonas sp. AA4]MEB0088959.1 GspH/FimT family pseudopilin [Pseudomonas sp. RTI1]MEB0126288.1 GspH/FimT family pseudopilin [Pseudomonas sp. CCC1.2]